jgi:omega-6 fatty acid desaturase (delta-12 desaturase)
MPDSTADRGAAGTASPSERAAHLKHLSDHCQSYRGSDMGRGLFQLVSTLVLFFAAIAVMFVAFHHGIYWLYALLMVPASGLAVRLFIIQHDCGHGSFFASRRANTATGRFLSVFTFIPYDLWRRAHNLHHAGSGNLDRRGAGDIDTLTVHEYKALSPRQQRLYRMFRHPLFLLVLGPPLFILFGLRLPPVQSVPFLDNYHPVTPRDAWRSVMGLNLSLVLIYGSIVALLGWKTGLLVYLPVVVTGFWIGVWLFFIQHQFEDAYWNHKDKWSYQEAALQGSSYYVLPRLLQWFTGNIGFHHIHHLCPGIPNYRLEQCFNTNSDLANCRRITFRDGLKSIRLALWDEDSGKMIRFRDLSPAA